VTEYVPTNNLRYVRRLVPETGQTERVLQQEWEKRFSLTETFQVGGDQFEWRDIVEIA
jgi:hypothetical protein